MISFFWFEILITVSTAAAAITPVILLFMLFYDWRRKKIW